MGHIVNGLSDLVPKVQVAAIRCLHSLSRSVRQLRTSFQDQEVWKPIRPVGLLSVLSLNDRCILKYFVQVADDMWSWDFG